jgi:hypothetical protein
MISMLGARAALNAYTALYTATSHIKIYSGAIPSNCGAAATGTLLSSGMAFSATAFPASTDSVTTGLATATANAIASDTNAAATGTAGYFRTVDGGGATTLAQGTCGTSAADMIMNTTTITAGDTISCSSFVITLADGSGND